MGVRVRRVGFVIVVVLAMGGPSAAAGPAQAPPGDTPTGTVTVTPADGLADGQTVDVAVTGLSGDLSISQCDPALVDRYPDGTVLVSYVHCRNQSVEDVTGPIVVPFTLRDEYETSYRGEVRSTRCGGVGPDCLVVVRSREMSGVALAPVHFGPPRPAPAVSVAPSRGLHVGDAVQVEVRGFGAESHFLVGQCESEVVTAPDPESLIYGGACASLMGFGAWDDPVTVSLTIAEAWVLETAGGARAHRCGDEPGDCVIAAFAPDSGAFVFTPIDVDPSPVAVVPADQEAGFPVHVLVSGRPDSTVRVAQCRAPARATLAASRCTASTRVRLDGDGEGMAALALVDSIVTRGAHRRPVRCSAVACVVAVFDRTGRTVGSAPITVYPADGPPVLSVEPTVDLTDGSVVVATISEFRNDEVWLAQCAASVGVSGDVDGGPCYAPQLVGGEREHASVAPHREVVAEFTGADGTQVSCTERPGACVIAIESRSGDLDVVPIAFAP